MSNEFDSLFEVLEPPRGGLSRLRARIDRESRRWVRVVWLRAAVAASFVAAIGVLGVDSGHQAVRV